MTHEPVPDPAAPRLEVDTTTDTVAPADAPRNRPARVSAYLATGAVVCLVSITSLAGLYLLGYFATVAALCGLGAIVTGHVGLVVGRRTGAGRGAALISIIVGWLAVIVVGVGALLSFTLFAGLAFLTS